MSRKKLPDRKRKRIIKKYMILSASMIAFVCVIVFVLLQFAPKQSYISPLPKIGIFQSQNPSQQQIDQIKNLLSQKQIDYHTVVASDSSYMVTLSDGGMVILSGQKSLEMQISSLQFILSRLTMEGKPFARLDLRFDKPVIKLRD